MEISDPAGDEVRTLLPAEAVEDSDGNLAVIDVDAAGHRYVKFWLDSAHIFPVEEQAVQRVPKEYEAASPARNPLTSTHIPCAWCQNHGGGNIPV